MELLRRGVETYLDNLVVEIYCFNNGKRLERLNLITRRKEWRVVTYSITSNGMKLLPHLSKMVYGD